MPKFDTRHGGPFDRGGADFWYNRGYDPHYYTGGSYASDRVEKVAEGCQLRLHLPGQGQDVRHGRRYGLQLL